MNQVNDYQENYQTGWVKLYRSLENKGWYKKPKYVLLWIHILLKANHHEAEFWFNGKNTKVKKGQFITGRKSLSEETGISETSIERILRTFENEQQIGQQKTNRSRLITVLQYNDYQKADSKTDNGRTTNGQRADTNNKNKNYNKNNTNDLFNSFWNGYDKKVGKRETAKIWDRLSLKDQTAALGGVNKYKSAREKKYRKDPQRYLSKRVWEDEIEINNTINTEKIKELWRK